MSDTPRTDAEEAKNRSDEAYSYVGSHFARQLERELAAEKAAHHQTTLNWMAECESAAALTVRVGQLERDLSAAVERAEAAETRADDLSTQVADLKRERDEARAAQYNANGMLLLLGFRKCDIQGCNCNSYHTSKERKAAGLDA